MAISVSESEVMRLVRFYRNAVRDLTNDFISTFDFEKISLAAKTRQVLRIIEGLDERTEKWARRNIEHLYRAALSESDKMLQRQLGKLTLSVAARQSWNDIDSHAIHLLMADSEFGFLTGLRSAMQQIKNSIRSIKDQARMLQLKQKVFDAAVESVGLFDGNNANFVRDKIVDEILEFKKATEQEWRQNVARLSTDSLIKNVVNLPYIHMPDKRAHSGYRMLRIDNYAEMLAKTKSNQAANLARRNSALRHNIELMQISTGPASRRDACNLYRGKVFALTEGAMLQYGVPHISELPNGGAPFHPTCTHLELPYIPETKTSRELTVQLHRPPKWALNRSWSLVQKEFRSRGYPGDVEDSSKTKGVDMKPRIATVRSSKKKAIVEQIYENAAMGFLLPGEFSSLETNDAFNNAIVTQSIKDKVYTVFEKFVSDVSNEFSVSSKIERKVIGSVGKAVGEMVVLKCSGNDDDAKIVALSAGWVMGQDAVRGFCLSNKSADSKCILIKLRRQLQNSELVSFQKQPGMDSFLMVGKNVLLVEKPQKADVETFKHRTLHALEVAARRKINFVANGICVVPTRLLYTEHFLPVLKYNKSVHNAARRARAVLRKIVFDSTGKTEGLQFKSGYRMGDILSRSTMAKVLKKLVEEKGIDLASIEKLSRDKDLYELFIGLLGAV